MKQRSVDTLLQKSGALEPEEQDELVAELSRSARTQDLIFRILFAVCCVIMATAFEILAYHNVIDIRGNPMVISLMNHVVGGCCLASAFNVTLFRTSDENRPLLKIIGWKVWTVDAVLFVIAVIASVYWWSHFPPDVENITTKFVFVFWQPMFQSIVLICKNWLVETHEDLKRLAAKKYDIGPKPPRSRILDM